MPRRVPTKADVEAELKVLRTEHEALKTRYDKHLKEIGAVAMRYATDHDWCETVEEALEEAKVPIPRTEIEFEVTFAYTAKSRRVFDNPEDAAEFINTSTMNSDFDLQLDSDFQDVEKQGYMPSIKVVSLK